MSGSVSSDNAEPNLTPMLDMVFQLITFFMVVASFKQKEIDADLKLPVIGSARPVSKDGRPDEQLLVLNVNSKGNLTIMGEIIGNDEARIKQAINAQAKTNTDTRLGGKDYDPEQGLPATVVIRSDKETKFGMVNRVLRACQDVGYRKFALKAQSDTRAPAPKVE